MQTEMPFSPEGEATEREALIGHTLAIAIVDWRQLPAETHVRIMEQLRNVIEKTGTYYHENVRRNLFYREDEGEVFLTFLHDITAPFRCAQDITEDLAKQHEIQIRMGIHTGPVQRTQAPNGQTHVIGESLLEARRVRDYGDARHLLVSKYVADRVNVLSLGARHWAQHMKPFPDVQSLEDTYARTLYNFYKPGMGNPHKPRRLWHKDVAEFDAHILYMDMVGSSALPKEIQTDVYRELSRIVTGTTEFKKAKEAGQLIPRTSGDGVMLAFSGDTLAPLRCAREIALAVKDHDRIKLRMGIHSGPIDRVKDINGQDDVSGETVIFAARVMSCGGEGHILITEPVARTLAGIPIWARMVHPAGSRMLKNKTYMDVYSIWCEEFGNPQMPKAKLYEGDQGTNRLPDQGIIKTIATPLPPRQDKIEEKPVANTLSYVSIAVVFALLGLGVYGLWQWNGGKNLKLNLFPDRTDILSASENSSGNTNRSGKVEPRSGDARKQSVDTNRSTTPDSSGKKNDSNPEPPTSGTLQNKPAEDHTEAKNLLEQIKAAVATENHEEARRLYRNLSSSCPEDWLEVREAKQLIENLPIEPPITDPAGGEKRREPTPEERAKPPVSNTGVGENPSSSNLLPNFDKRNGREPKGE